MEEVRWKIALEAASLGSPAATHASSSTGPWELRRSSLLRSLYPSACSPSKLRERPDTVVASGSNQLIAYPAGGAGVRLPTVGQKRPREEEADELAALGNSRAIIPIDPELLRCQTGGAGPDPSIVSPHPQWKLRRVYAGSKGRICALAVEPGGQWFATGGAECVIKVWDLATPALKLNLVGHQETIRGLAMSERSPFMFSCSEDHSVKCWDLEQNCVVRDFHGHLSAVYAVATHPTLDVIFTGGRDATVRVWDLRTRKDVHVLQGHRESIMSLAAQPTDPQLVSGSADATVVLWDLGAGKAMAKLTRHKKPVRSVVIHPVENTMVTCGADNVRKWRLPTGEFFCNLNLMPGAPEEGLWSCASLSAQDILFVGGEDGGMRFYNWSTHTMFQYGTTPSARGTLAGEGGILCCSFDKSGSRLLTGEGDKTIKMWREAEVLQ